MGTSHSLAYDSMPEFVIVGLVSRGESKATLAARLSTPPPLFSTLEEALAATHPDVQIFALSRQKLSSSPDPITAKFKNIEFVKGDCLHP